MINTVTISAQQYREFLAAQERVTKLETKANALRDLILTRDVAICKQREKLKYLREANDRLYKNYSDAGRVKGTLEARIKELEERAGKREEDYKAAIDFVDDVQADIDAKDAVILQQAGLIQTHVLHMNAQRRRIATAKEALDA